MKLERDNNLSIFLGLFFDVFCLQLRPLTKQIYFGIVFFFQLNVQQISQRERDPVTVSREDQMGQDV